jgi:succinylglutamic semialdehyde dehydrogenase
MIPGLYINGEWLTGYGKQFVSKNPATLETNCTLAAASPADVIRAIRAAKQAFDKWCEASYEERKMYITTYAEELKSSQSELEVIISKETGKPLWETKNEVTSMINKVDISIRAYEERCPERVLKQVTSTSITRHKPHGVIAILGPFNFPGHLPNGHIVPAILAGNTIVFKPSELTPLTAEIMVRCWDRAGLPPGVLNLVQGGSDIGKHLSSNKEIDGLFFTGSYDTGKALTKLFADDLGKILALEMGGNNPIVLGQTENIDAAAYITLTSAFITSGQRCSCARRLIVPEGPHGDKFIDKLIEFMGKIVIGKYDSKPEPFIGPVISERAVVKLLMAQGSLETKKAKPLVRLTQPNEDSYFVTPGLIDVTGIQDIEDVEYFGPFLQLKRVPNFQQAIIEANNTQYGLTAGLISDNREEFDIFYRRIKAGVINWNMPLTGASSEAPFGGVKHSGNNRPSAFYAADYCAYPVASMESEHLSIPKTLLPGLKIHE